MIQALKNSFSLNNTRLLFLCIFVFISGTSAGSFFGSALDITDKQILSKMLISHTDPSAAAMIPMLLVNTAFLLLIYFSGITFYASPFALFLLFSKSFSTGFCGLLMASEINSIGIFKFLQAYLLPNFILSIVYLLAAVSAISYSLPAVRSGNPRTDERTGYFISFSLLAVITVLASIFASL